MDEEVRPPYWLGNGVMLEAVRSSMDIASVQCDGTWRPQNFLFLLQKCGYRIAPLSEPVTDAQVEAAAIAIYDEDRPYGPNWHTGTHIRVKPQYLRKGRAALEAARKVEG